MAAILLGPIKLRCRVDGKLLGMDYQMPFNRFLAFGSYVVDILVLYRVYFSTCSLLFFVWDLPIWRRSGFKKLDSKTLGCSIQSFFEISEIYVMSRNI